MTLNAFVAAVCAGTSRPHALGIPRLSGHALAAGKVAWTARRYVQLEGQQLANESRHEDDRRAHERNIEELLARQKALIDPAVELVYRRTGVPPRVDTDGRDPRWAKGVPVFIGDEPYAVIAPVAGRIPGVLSRLSGLLLVVATE